MRKNRSRKPKSISKSKTGDIRELQELLGQLHDNWHITGCLTEPYFSSGRKIERLPVEEPLKPPAQFAAAGEELQAFCQSYAERWTLALNRANSGRELEAFANVFSSQELADLTDRHTRLFASLGKACHAAVSRSLSQPMLALTLDLFILPSLLEKYAWTNSADEYLQPRRTALRTNGGSGLSPLQQCMTHVLLLLLDAFCEGTEVAFNRFAGYWLNQHNDRMVHAAFTAPLWHCLYRSGWRHDAKLFKRIMNRYADTLGQLNEQHTNLQIFLIVNLLGYNLQSSREWNKMVFDNLIVPSIQRALKKKNYSYAHRLIERTDFSYAQQPHTEEQECLCREAWQPATLDAARGIRLNLPALQSCCQTHMPPVIAFVIDLEINRCSPIAVLFNMLLSTAKADRKEFVASVYSFHKVEPEVEVRFGNIGISVTDMSRIRGPLENDDFLRRLLALRDIMRGDRVDVTVYVHSTMFFITFASAAGLSPIQVFWSMGGYYSFRIKEIQGYITLGNVFEHLKDINGHDWRIVSGRMLPPGSDKLISQKAKQIREQHFGEYEVLLGTIARPQKLDSDAFLDALAEILHKNPKAAFLWFGQEELNQVKSKMQARGIARQCLFQGWVNGELYAHVLDIYLDSFPFPTGLALLEAIRAETPAVFLAGNRTESQTGIAEYIYAAFTGRAGTREQQDKARKIYTGENGENLLLCAKNLREYIEYTQRLIDEPAFRHAVAKACKTFMEAFMEDENRFGESFSSHMLEIIEEARLSTMLHS